MPELKDFTNDSYSDWSDLIDPPAKFTKFKKNMLLIFFILFFIALFSSLGALLGALLLPTLFTGVVFGAMCGVILGVFTGIVNYQDWIFPATAFWGVESFIGLNSSIIFCMLIGAIVGTVLLPSVGLIIGLVIGGAFASVVGLTIILAFNVKKSIFHSPPKFCTPTSDYANYLLVEDTKINYYPSPLDKTVNRALQELPKHENLP